MSATQHTDGYYSSADGLKLYFRDYPGPAAAGLDPLLCLPGLTRNSRDFDEVAALLCRRWRVLTTDLRGRGHSEHDPDRGHYHPAQYVDDVFALLEHLSLTRVAVIGTSLGGWMAMLMAHRRPAALSAVVLNDIGPELDPAGLARVATSAGLLPAVADWDGAVAELRRHTELVFPDWSAERWMAFARKLYEPAADGGLDVRLDRNVGVALREGRSGLREDPWMLFGALAPIPTLLVHGALSDILTAPIIRRMQAAKPDLAVVTVPNRGHAPNLDEPEAIDAIESFLAAHPADAG